MIATTSLSTTVSERRAALRALDRMVRDELAAAARRWQMDAGWSIDLTEYAQVYRRMPARGGHWTLFSARINGACHETATIAVAAEFEGDRVVELAVSGVRDVLAGGCTAAALCEALDGCGGPLHQVTPLPTGLEADGAAAVALMAAAGHAALPTFA